MGNCCVCNKKDCGNVKNNINIDDKYTPVIDNNPDKACIYCSEPLGGGKFHVKRCRKIPNSSSIGNSGSFKCAKCNKSIFTDQNFYKCDECNVGFHLKCLDNERYSYSKYSKY